MKKLLIYFWFKYNVWFSECGHEKYCNANFSGEFNCYTDDNPEYIAVIAYETTNDVKKDKIQLNSID